MSENNNTQSFAVDIMAFFVPRDLTLRCGDLWMNSANRKMNLWS
jgi:hypothetical protein